MVKTDRDNDSEIALESVKCYRDVRFKNIYILLHVNNPACKS